MSQVERAKKAYDEYRVLKTQLTKYVRRAQGAAGGMYFMDDYYPLNAKANLAWAKYLDIASGRA